jgi:hypothetical protein
MQAFECLVTGTINHCHRTFLLSLSSFVLSVQDMTDSARDLTSKANNADLHKLIQSVLESVMLTVLT